MTEKHQRFSQRRGIAAAGAALALLLPLAVIRAQSTPAVHSEIRMTELLSGKMIPLQLQMKDLAGGEWRRVTAVGKGITTTPAGSPSTSSAAPAYTRGQTVRVDGEAFLILYTLQSLGTKDTVTAQVVFGGKPTPDAPLALTLLSLRNVNALESVTAFDLSRETVTQAELDNAIVKARNDGTDVSLVAIGRGLLAYRQDHEGKMPPMESSESVKAAVGPYVRGNGNEYYFFSMTSRKPFAVNAALSNKPLAAISNPERTVAVYEAAPAPDGTRAAAFADGHVERFTETRWPEIARASGIPAP